MTSCQRRKSTPYWLPSSVMELRLHCSSVKLKFIQQYSWIFFIFPERHAFVTKKKIFCLPEIHSFNYWMKILRLLLTFLMLFHLTLPCFSTLWCNKSHDCFSNILLRPWIDWELGKKPRLLHKPPPTSQMSLVLNPGTIPGGSDQCSYPWFKKCFPHQRAISHGHVSAPQLSLSFWYKMYI